MSFVIGSVVNDKVLLQGLALGQTRTGSDMISGTVIVKGGDSIRFVTFDNTIVATLKAVGDTALVDAMVSIEEYNGMPSAKLSSLLAVYDLENESLSDYLQGLDVKTISKEIGALVSESLSPAGVRVVGQILKAESAGLKDAMAAMYGGYHDGVRGGLLNHIRKLLRYGAIAMDEYKELFTPVERDLFLIGLIVHDFGKMVELKDGAYTPYSIVPHTYWGIEVLSKHKDLIVKTYGEMFYVELQAIVLEHHGEFGERPKSVYAYLVHVVDLLDSRVSGLHKVLSEATEGASVKFDDYRMQFNRYGG